MKVGLVQMPVTADLQKNLAFARREILDLAERGAEIVVLPEMFCCPYDTARFAEYAEPMGGETFCALQSAARDAGVLLIGGSVPELDHRAVYNTCYVFDREEYVTRYRKMHLFDVAIPGGQNFRESDALAAGDSLAVVQTRFGTIGICICFDIRFPELARLYALAGVEILFVPAAFNPTTGPAHWELTMRARALDNQCYVVACAPAQDPGASYVSYGHSVVCSPWGDVVSQLTERAESRVVELDLSRIQEVREGLPLLESRRTDRYELNEI